MGELGSMTTGFPNQTREFCQDGFGPEPQPHPQAVPYHQNYDNQVPYQLPANTAVTPFASTPQPVDEWVSFPYEEPSQSPMAALQVIEEPISKIRFRYQSERGSHGSMSGKNSTHTQKTWPAVRLLNYPMSEVGEVKVRASLYTDDKCKPHVHKLLGKNCNQVLGDCVLPLQPDMTCSFPSLGVLFTEKKRVHDVLFKRKIEEYGGNIDEETRRQFLEDSKQEAKVMKLNTIRICFQAYNKNDHPITVPIFSEPVHNLKSPDSGELKITRLSRCTSRCDGGDEVFLLCEKVNKKDIRVKFFEQDEKGQETWSAFGKFSDSDVHHQVAIVFQTPAYRDRNIEKPVKVLVQLFRQNDSETSESLDFTYKPRDKDPEHIHNKRRRLNDGDNDFTGFGGGGGRHDFQGHQNQYYPPGPGHWQDGSGNSGSPMMGLHSQGYSMNQMAQFVNHFAEELKMSSSSSQDSFASAQSDLEGSAVSSTSVPSPIPVQIQPLVLSGSFSTVPIASSTATLLNDPEVTSLGAQSGEDYQLPFDELEPFEMDSTIVPNDVEAEMGPMIFNMKSLKISSKDEDLVQPDVEVSKSRRGSKSKVLPQVSKPHNQPTAKPLDRERSESRPKPNPRRLEASRGPLPYRRHSDIETGAPIENFVKRTMIPRFGQSLRIFTSTGNIQPLLGSLAPFLALQNEEGDNAVHLAVIHQPTNQKLFEQLMPIVNSLISRDVINHSNNKYQTPLHLAVAVGEVDVVTCLLFCGADPNLQDHRGNTPFHLATLKRDHRCLEILLDKAHYRSHLPRQALPNTSVLNYDGYSALHLAVLSGCKSCLSLLMDAEANVNIRDGTSGRTPLHMAVEMQSPLIEELLKQSSIDVNTQDYAGNTALHLVCSLELFDVAHMLMRARANPLIRNFIWDYDEVDEEDSEIQDDDNNDYNEEPHGQSAFDLAKDNEKLLSILRDNLSEVEKTDLEVSRRRSREELAKMHKPEPSSTERGGAEGPMGFHATKDVHSPKGSTSTDTAHDSGYGDSGVVIQDMDFGSNESESLLKELCTLLDPPSKEWEKLALVVCEDESLLKSMHKLEVSPTRTLLKKIKERDLILTNVLDAAGLLDICRNLPDFENRALNI